MFMLEKSAEISTFIWICRRNSNNDYFLMLQNILKFYINCFAGNNKSK